MPSFVIQSFGFLPQALQPCDRGGSAVRQFHRVDGNPPVISGGVEVSQKLDPVSAAVADDGWLGAAVGAAQGVSAADVTNQRADF